MNVGGCIAMIHPPTIFIKLVLLATANLVNKAQLALSRTHVIYSFPHPCSSSTW